MRKLAFFAAAAATLIAAPPLLAREKLTGEARLAKMLEGREPGRPASCIPYSATADTTVIDKTAIVYSTGTTIWVNRPRNAAELDDDNIMVTNIHGASLCRLDIVRTHDRTGGFFNGFVALDDFVPYRKVKTGS